MDNMVNTNKIDTVFRSWRVADASAVGRKKTNNGMEPIRKALDHRPFNEKSESHQAFLRKLLVDLEGVSELVNVEDEIRNIRNKLL